MNLVFWDWLIIALFCGIILYSVMRSRRYMRSVADFLAANRTAGRYLLAISQGICAVGAVSIIALWEQNYTAGFAMRWWEFAMVIVVLLIAISGWVTYRYRQTRCLTLAQFFEERYSRKFRIFAGGLSFAAGIVNYGIFPAIEAYFFLYFCGIPYSPLSYTLAIAVILGLSITFVLAGGQIAVVITDFLQGLFVSLTMVLVVSCVLWQVGWDPIVTLLSNTPENQSLVNPFKTGNVEIFNYWFFLINVAIVIYNKNSWQGTQGFNASARNAHEAKMGEILATWRGIPYAMMYLVIPIAAHAVMSSGEIQFAAAAGTVNDQLIQITAEHSSSVARQMTTPLVLVQILPAGFKGLLAAIMVAAALSTHASYLHSWGSIFIQDVVMPLRKTPLSPAQHLRCLRWAIVGVSAFAFTFSWFYTPSDAILPFMMVTGVIFCGGAGAAIIGGLYWRKGSTAGAWSGMIAGSFLAVLAILIPFFWDKDSGVNFRLWLGELMTARGLDRITEFVSADKFPINGAWMTLFAMVAALSVYILVSLWSRTDYNLDKLLKRGIYAVETDLPPVINTNKNYWKYLGVSDEFSGKDKCLCMVTYAWNIGWMFFFLAVTATHFLSLALGNGGIPDSWWMDFWQIFIWTNLGIGIIITVWFAIGGSKDLFYMFRRLETLVRDDSDNGTVRTDKDQT